MRVNWEKLNTLNKPYFRMLRKDIKSIRNSGQYILNKKVERFEKEVANYLNIKYCTAVGNGLDALTIALLSLNLPSGSEVIVPSNTFYASVLSIIRAGLKPVLCEPDIDSFNITSDGIKKLINKKTSAIMVVHLYGNPCRMKEICSLAKENGLKVIEDCAQAFGSDINGKKLGTFGDVAAFSFYPTKNLGGIGDAGLIATNNNVIYNYARKARTYGGENYIYDVKGINSRMDEIHAAFLTNKLKDIDKINNKKIENAQLYLKKINNPNIILPKVETGFKHIFHIFCIKVNDRDSFKQYLDKRGIKTLIHYPVPLAKQKVLNGIIKGKYPVSNGLSETILSLPCSAAHTKKEIEYVIKVINNYRR